MNNINKKFIDKELYAKVRDDVSKIYKYPSAYKSMAIVKAYKDAGGRILDNKNKKEGTNRWLDEKWINVDAYINENKIVKCGDSEYVKKSACRPLVKVNKNTPITIDEVIKNHSIDDINKVIKIKNKNPQNYIMDWINLRVIPKNKSKK